MSPTPERESAGGTPGDGAASRPGAGLGLLKLAPYAGVLALGAWEGFPRLRRVLFPAPGDPGALHAWIALAAWVIAAAAVLGLAARSLRRETQRERDQSRLRILGPEWRNFKRNLMGVLGLHGVLLLVLVTLTAPLLAPYDPDRIDAGSHLAPPSLAYPFGTDDYGRDLYSRLLYGSRISLSVGFLAVGISATFGALWGAASGYVGGKVDSLMMWAVDLLLSLPRLVLVLTIVGLFRPRGASGIYVIVLVLGLTQWMGVSRIVRGMVLSLREQDFVLAARALGQSERLIVTRHLLPNAVAPVIVHATLGIGATILAEATLSFLGLGVPPPISTWGSIVSDGREFIRSAWWIAALPGLLIVFAVMSFNLLGDGLRDALDPKLRHR